MTRGPGGTRQGTDEQQQRGLRGRDVRVSGVPGVDVSVQRAGAVVPPPGSVGAASQCSSARPDSPPLTARLL